HTVILANSPFNRGEEFALVVAVEMDFVVDAVGSVTLLELTDDVRLAGDRAQRRNPIVVAHQLSGDGAGFDVAGPAHQTRHAERAFPTGILFRAVRRHRAIRPGVHV